MKWNGTVFLEQLPDTKGSSSPAGGSTDVPAFWHGWNRLWHVLGGHAIPCARDPTTDALPNSTRQMNPLHPSPPHPPLYLLPFDICQADPITRKRDLIHSRFPRFLRRHLNATWRNVTRRKTDLFRRAQSPGTCTRVLPARHPRVPGFHPPLAPCRAPGRAHDGGQ